VLAAPLDLLNQFRDRGSLCTRYVPQLTPEGIFEADARSVSTNDDGTFYDCGLHCLVLIQPIIGIKVEYLRWCVLPIEETNSR
jgi:hypothetical protein